MYADFPRSEQMYVDLPRLEEMYGDFPRSEQMYVDLQTRINVYRFIKIRTMYISCLGIAWPGAQNKSLGISSKLPSYYIQLNDFLSILDIIYQ